ncbi:MAG: Fe-S cluster assembly protein SufD [Xanthomonadales bacterium]|nr:Fe-S cluster assembly protein SufD [Gammaproteobacteria bacterium]NNL04354.1 Fe-S cluster assembly protein SufD [Xanthomonadales bacterium]
MSNATLTELAARWADQVRKLDTPASPTWLEDLRHKATGHFSAGGFPHRKVEAWRYTPLKRLESAGPGLPGKIASTCPVTIDAALLPDVPAIDIVDGVLAQGSAQLPDGVSVFTLAEAIEMFEGPVRALAEAVPVDGPARAFDAINTAFLHQGVVIRVEKGADAGTLLLRFAGSARSADEFVPCRVMLLMEAGARLELVEQHLAEVTSPAALHLLVQPHLAENAELEHVRVQDEGEEAILLTTTRVQQDGASCYRFRGFDLGGGLVRHELHVSLEGEGARADLAGAWVLDGRRHCDTRVAVEHVAPDCSSVQFFRGVLGGSSRGVFNGRALIREGADGSSVRQSNANLLLSPLAEMDTKPELEIYADEVEASHGATVGQLDEGAIFYLRTRGLTEAQARRLLTAAFCHAVSQKLNNAALAENLGERIGAAMPESV